MRHHLAKQFKAARLAKGLTLEGLAHLTGHKNTRKVAGKIARFELGGAISEELFSRLGDALGIDFLTIEGLLAQEASYALQRPDGRYLTAEILRWSADPENAQRCDVSEARAIRGWLAGIGIQVTIIDLSASIAAPGNFAE